MNEKVNLDNLFMILFTIALVVSVFFNIQLYHKVNELQYKVILLEFKQDWFDPVFEIYQDPLSNGTTIYRVARDAELARDGVVPVLYESLDAAKTIQWTLDNWGNQSVAYVWGDH